MNNKISITTLSIFFIIKTLERITCISSPIRSKTDQFDHQQKEIMSWESGSSNPKLDLKLNLSPPRANSLMMMDSPRRSATASPTSPPSSCVSSEMNQDDGEASLRYSDSPEATSMVVLGCPTCLMFVMLSEKDPKCPKCKSTVLVEPSNDNITPTMMNSRRS